MGALRCLAIETLVCQDRVGVPFCYDNWQRASRISVIGQKNQVVSLVLATLNSVAYNPMCKVL